MKKETVSENFEEIVSFHIKKAGVTKKALASHLNLTYAGLKHKFNQRMFSDFEVDQIAEHLGVSKKELNSYPKTQIEQQPIDHIEDMINKAIGKIVDEKDHIIDQQRFIITTMSEQLRQALGKEWHSEELPVIGLDSKKLQRLPIDTNYSQAS